MDTFFEFEKSEQSLAILLVDDSSLLRQAYSHALKSWGYRVDVAVDGIAGFECFQSGEYQMVITDYEMPSCNGVDFLKRARNEVPSKAQIPFLLVTGTPLEELGARLNGFASVLTKPVGLRVLRAELDRFLMNF
jgi:two-component system, chemotaxis family, chemotaxis protein CheY